MLQSIVRAQLTETPLYLFTPFHKPYTQQTRHPRPENAKAQTHKPHKVALLETLNPKPQTKLAPNKKVLTRHPKKSGLRLAVLDPRLQGHCNSPWFVAS